LNNENSGFGTFVGSSEVLPAADGRILALFRGMAQDEYDQLVTAGDRVPATEERDQRITSRTEYLSAESVEGGKATVQSVAPDGTFFEIQIA
jgi:hypothetical protein